MTSGRGNPRFKGGGSLWKTSWRRRVPYTEMAFFEGFSTGLGGASYSDAQQLQGSIDGFMVGAVVRILTPPTLGTVRTIARSSDGAPNRGWDLVLTNPGPDADGFPQVGFSFRAGNGVATIVAFRGPFTLRALTEDGIDALVFRVAAGIFPEGGPFATGSIATFVENYAPGLAQVGMGAAPFTNPGQILLTMGVGAAGTDFSTPNGIHGIAGGLTNELSFAQLTPLVESWMDAIAAQYQLAELGGIISDGWRANYPLLSVSDAPEPLEPYVGSVNMEPGNPLGTLQYRRYAPTIFWADTQ
jgi:hypothetical protein